MIKIIRILFTVCLCFVFNSLKAQDEYRSEIGVMGGGSYYLGDANNQLFTNNQLDYGLLFRQKLNTRLAMVACWNSTNVSGSTFTNKVDAFDLAGEFNFFDYDDKAYKPDSRKQTFFLQAGLGFMMYPYNNASSIMFSYNLGIGYKIMLGKRFNLNLVWSNKLLLTDQMEGTKSLNNPNGLNGSNLFNNDVLSTFTVGISYDIFKKPCKCLQYKY